MPVIVVMGIIKFILFFSTFLIFSVPASVIDTKHKRIPDLIVFPAIAVLSVFRKICFGDPLVRILLEILLGYLIFIGIRFLTKGKLGMGDAKFAALMGVFIGFPGWFAATGLASLLGLVFAVTGLFSGRIDKNTKIPFAPFLTAGSIAAYFVNYDILLKIQVWM